MNRYWLRAALSAVGFAVGILSSAKGLRAQSSSERAPNGYIWSSGRDGQLECVPADAEDC